MTLWLLITASLIVQEGLSVTVVLLDAYHQHYPLFVIHVIWLVVTVLQIYAGFYLGKWIQKKFAGVKFEVWMQRASKKLEKSIGEQGEEVGLVLISGLISPAFAALGASWLEISFAKVFLFALLGDLLWYLSTWMTVIGAAHLLSDYKGDAVGIVTTLAVLYLVFKFARKK